MEHNPFAKLGMLMIPVMVDKMVDGYVTAETSALLAKSGKAKIGEAKAAAAADRDVVASYDYISSDRFRMKLNSKSGSNDGPSFRFERRGALSWKVIKLELPSSLME